LVLSSGDCACLWDSSIGLSTWDPVWQWFLIIRAYQNPIHGFFKNPHTISTSLESLISGENFDIFIYKYPHVCLTWTLGMISCYEEWNPLPTKWVQNKEHPSQQLSKHPLGPFLIRSHHTYHIGNCRQRDWGDAWQPLPAVPLPWLMTHTHSFIATSKRRLSNDETELSLSAQDL
jgi:hypothetical protein